MESWYLISKHKSWLLYWLFMFMMSLNFMVQRVQGVCIEEESKALLEMKASLLDSDAYDRYWSYSSKKPLPTWFDHGTSGGRCCEWERVKCDSTSGHVTHLSLTNILLLPDDEFNPDQYFRTSWLLNFSIFLRFEELTSLDLSYNNIRVSTGFEMLSSLKKLELLNLSSNYIENDFFPSLSSLKILDLGYNFGSTNHDIIEFAALENLEVLDLSYGNYSGTFQMQGSRRDTILKKLKILNLGGNKFNASLITSLSSHSSFKALDLSYNKLSGSFPAEELARLTKLEKLDLSYNYDLNVTPSIQVCKSLLRMKRLETLSLRDHVFNKSIISCLSFLPSLNTLDLWGSFRMRGSFPMQELSSFKGLKTLDMSGCGFQSPMLNEWSNLRNLEVLLLMGNNFGGTLPIQALTSFHNLEVLDLSYNNFVGSISSTIKSLSSLRVVSFAGNALDGSLSHDHGLCELKKLQELILSENNFNGKLPECFNMLSSLKVFDISSNQFTGTFPPSLIANLTSLEYIDIGDNQFEGLFSFSIFSHLTKLEMVKLECNNDKLEVETEEPEGWIAMFQLKVLVLSNCNVNRRKGSISPSFLLHQHDLKVLDLSLNSLKGQFPNWLIENNAMLEFLILRNNSIGGSMSFDKKVNIRYLDMSRNVLNGTIPSDTQKKLPKLYYLNLSSNYLHGAIPSSFGNLSLLRYLDLSHNELSREVPKELFTNVLQINVLKLSNNRLCGNIFSGNLNLGNIRKLHLDGNNFTGKIENGTTFHGTTTMRTILDISDNFFTGISPGWISNSSGLSELLMRNNSFEGQFPCGRASLFFLDISQNSFSGPIPSCSKWKHMEHLHLGSNRFTGSIPISFHNLAKLLTLDISNNNLSGRIPEFLGEFPNLRILLLGNNNFVGTIPNQLCQLSNASWIDLSGNSLSGAIPTCFQNITGPHDLAFSTGYMYVPITYPYESVIITSPPIRFNSEELNTPDEAQFTTKSMSRSYKGNILNYMSGLDLSCNKLTGEIPSELGMLTQIHALNLSHNQLTGPIPASLSNLGNIESMDLSSNFLSGHIPLELTKLNSLAIFNVSYNNLSGKLPEMKAQFGTFTKDCYKGNPLLCGPPLEKECMPKPRVTHSSAEEHSDEKWFSIDMASFYGSCASTWFVFMLGFAAVLYTNPNWRRRWLYLVEECMYTCYYFIYDLIWNPSMLFRN